MNNDIKFYNKRSTTNIDRLIGLKLIIYRKLKNKSLNDIAKTLNVSLNQIRKYEKGINRITAANLHRISIYLDIDIKNFFTDTKLLDIYE